jgi:hypothetical protein
VENEENNKMGEKQAGGQFNETYTHQLFQLHFIELDDLSLTVI